MTTLVMSSRHTVDDQMLWRAAIRREWQVVRARGIRLPPVEDDEIVIYIEALYAQTVARQLKRCLEELPEDWLTKVPRSLTGRSIELMTLGEARRLNSPAFAKPPNDKSFTAKVYADGSELPAEYDDAMRVLVSEPVSWTVEYRCFCLDGRVKTMSPYIRNGVLSAEEDFAANDNELAGAAAFAEKVCVATQAFSPRAVVIDVGQIEGFGWAVVEANAAWGSGIYGCDPDVVLDVIRHATTVHG